MKGRIHTLILIASISLAGCTTQGREWTRDDTPKSEADQALAECQYEAEAATATIGANNRPKTWGDAISEGVASGVVRGMDEAELVKSCMRARGFTQ